MLRIIQSAVGAAAIGATSLFGFAGAGPAEAQPEQEGLINVNITNVTVQVPVAVAANVCGLDVNVLAGQADFGSVNCDADADANADDGTVTQIPGVEQQGLVNLNLQDVTVQVPVALAANICDVDVNVIARQLELPNDATCDSFARANADN